MGRGGGVISILVADFDLTRRYVIGRVLRGAGYDVVEVGDADSADALLERQRFAVAFLAARLSGGDGFELCRKWTGRGVPVVLMAADFRLNPLLQARAIDCGARDLVSSMVDRTRVLELVARIVGPASAAE